MVTGGDGGTILVMVIKPSPPMQINASKKNHQNLPLNENK